MSEKQVGALHPAPYNPRRIEEAELAGLKQALEVFGDLGGIVFNRRTEQLVGGHQRVKTLDKSWPLWIAPDDTLTEGDRRVGTVAMGFIETPFGRLSYREVDWDQKIEKAANMAANKWGGSWDDAALKDLLTEIDDGSGLIGLSGFNEVDLSGLMDRDGVAAMTETPAEKEQLFEQLTFVVTRAQMSDIGFALDKADKAGPFGETGNANKRGNALARIAAAYMKGS